MKSFFIAITMGMISAVPSMVLGQMYFETKFKTPFELSDGKNTATYQEIINHYKTLDEKYSQAKLLDLGLSDAGDPLHAFIVSQDLTFDPRHPSRKDKIVVMIMNGIHPGEPDGIDAGMMFFDVILGSQEGMKEYKDLIFVVIPVYNVGGCKNQSPFRRANQNGPSSYGSRGNGRNLDLNRDFIKADSRNTRLFHKLFKDWDPDLFLDTHVSNGADYTYTNTLLATTSDKLPPPQKELLEESLEPFLYQRMKKAGHEMIPYVNVFRGDPKDGYSQFYDSPRYSTGYAALHGCIGFMLENHMLKDFKERVYSTFEFLLDFGTMALKYRKEIKEARSGSASLIQGKKSFPIQWTLDKDQQGSLEFKGYEKVPTISQVTGDTVWVYDREKPWEEEIPYWKRYKVVDSVSKPFAYLIPFAWSELAEELKRNGVEVKKLKTDLSVDQVTHYKISKIETSRRISGGHYYHWQVETEELVARGKFEKEDLLVLCDQEKVRFIIETLEPRATDSYFRWNYFDQVLQRQEWFSTYVFDSYAEKFLEENPEVRAKFDKKMKEDEEFAGNPTLQYIFIFDESPYSEPEYMLYPISRIENPIDF